MVKSLLGTLALAAAFMVAVPAAAQQAGEPAESAWTAADEDRSTVLRFLERDDVSRVVEGMGHDVQDVGRAALDLSATDAARVAGEVRAAEHAIAAQTISFTTTTLIIILLVVILLVLVVD